MRRISTGIVGRELLGRFTAFDNSLRSIENNQDIVLNPNGSGIIQSDAHIQVNDENSVRFADSGSSNYVEIKAPASLGSNITLTLPDSTTAGNVLTTDGSGNLTFSDLAIEVSNQTADTDTYYPLLSTSDSGSISSVDVSSSKLSFQPSSGTLTATTFSGSFSGDLSGSAATVTLTADNSTNATRYPLFSDNATGNVSPRTDTGFTYNPSSGELTATILTASSDERLKSDIVNIEDALSKVVALRGVDFTRTATGVLETGVIAQEVESVLPRAVTTGEDGFKNIAYGNIVGVLIEAIKELNAEIVNLKQK